MFINSRTFSYCFVEEPRCSELVTRQLASHGRRRDARTNIEQFQNGSENGCRVDHPCGQPHLPNHTGTAALSS